MVVTMLPTGCLIMVKSFTSLFLSFFTWKTILESLAILLPRRLNKILHLSTLNRHQAVVRKGQLLFGM